ncbi:MAG: tetratricopeptide repeat protein [Selenomonadaceae bacterium]|nr:tetratricopeptide repeat protein [Selenomonadaceae bacterium]
MNLKKIFRRVTPILFAGIIFFTSTNANAEIQTYTGEGSYIMSEGENLSIAKERAKADAMRNACEQAGTFVESTTQVANMMVTKDEIITMTGGIVKLLEDPAYAPLKELENLEGILISVKVKVSIDSEDVLKWMKKSSSERAQLVKQMDALQKANAEQERQIAELKRQLAAATSANERQQIAQGFASEEDKFMSNQKVEEAWELEYDENYNGAIKLFDEAIQLDPNNALAYYGRGTAYSDINQNENALRDLNKSIELNPNDDFAYNNRGIVYKNLGQYERAIQDYDRAVQLSPNDAATYYNRGNAYNELKQYERAIQDYDKALELNPDHANTYFNRGMAYKSLENYEAAIDDFTTFIELEPDDADAYKMRGECYEQLGDDDAAQEDFDRADELANE